MGDLNESSQTGPFAQTLLDAGFYTPMMAGLDVKATFSQGEIHTCIDTIVVSPDLRGRVGLFKIMEQGTAQHNSVHLSIVGAKHHQVGSVLDAPPAFKEVRVDRQQAEQIWTFAGPLLQGLIDQSDLDGAWTLWSRSYENILSRSCDQPLHRSRRGQCPVFRQQGADRGARTAHRLHQALRQAASNEEYERLVHELCEHQQRQAAQALRDWQSAMSVSERTHSRFFWNWLRGPRKTPAHQLLRNGILATGPAACLAMMRQAWSVIFNAREENEPTQIVDENPRLAVEGDGFADLDFERFKEELFEIIKTTAPHQAHGLDNWRAAEWRVMDKLSATQFAKVAFLAIRLHRTPLAWKQVKVAFLPKSDSRTPDPLSHRPLAIMSLAYRTVAKWIARDMVLHLQHLDRRSAGGLPGRAGIDAWFDIMARLELNQMEPWEAQDIVAAQVDTEKFFDAVPHQLAVDLLLLHGVRPCCAALWRDQIVHHRKFLFLGPYADVNGMLVSRGIPQGDAISMFAALVVMDQWMTTLQHCQATLRCYVDDRLIYGQSVLEVQEAIAATEGWDATVLIIKEWLPTS